MVYLVAVTQPKVERLGILELVTLHQGVIGELLLSPNDPVNY